MPVVVKLNNRIGEIKKKKKQSSNSSFSFSLILRIYSCLASHAHWLADSRTFVRFRIEMVYK
jgi:hypothetical protein